MSCLYFCLIFHECHLDDGQWYAFYFACVYVCIFPPLLGHELALIYWNLSGKALLNMTLAVFFRHGIARM